MTLKHTLALLVKLEAEGKLLPAAQDVETLYDPNHLIHLTVKATGADVREQFLAAVLAGEDLPEPHEAATARLKGFVAGKADADEAYYTPEEADAANAARYGDDKPKRKVSKKAK